MRVTPPLRIFNDKSNAWLEGFIGTVDIFHFQRDYEDLPYRRYWQLLGICESF